MAEKDEIITEQEELLEKRGSIIVQQERHTTDLKTKMEENDKYHKNENYKHVWYGMDYRLTILLKVMLGTGKMERFCAKFRAKI